MLFGLTQLFTGGLLKIGWSGTRNFARGLRGEAKAIDIATGEARRMSPRERLVQDLKRRHINAVSGAETTGYGPDLRPKTVLDEHGIPQPVPVNHWDNTTSAISDAVFGPLGLALGWGTRTVGKVGAYAAYKSVRPLGHATYQAAALAKDIGLGGASILHSMANNKVGREMLFLAPSALVVANEVFKDSEHYALNRGLQQWEGEDLAPTWGSITPSPRRLDNFGADGQLVFAMHNQR